MATILKLNCSKLLNLCWRSRCRDILNCVALEKTMATASVEDYPTAGIIIIGDEILKGQTQDTNTYFITNHLYNLGIRVKKVSVISDDITTIADEVRRFSDKFTYVITTGGIGPTHDDVTLEAVASAFGEKLCPHPHLVSLIEEWFKTSDLNSPAMKMALVPETAKLNFGEDKERGIVSRFPIISVKNVTIFPGVPKLLERSFRLLSKKLFSAEGKQFKLSTLYLTADEVTVAPALNNTVRSHQHVAFGSYPELFHSYYKTRITIEASSQKDVEEAEKHLREHINKDYFVNYKTDTVSQPWLHIEKLLETLPDLKEQFRVTEKILEECLDRYRAEELCVCFNGGKDCLVVLHSIHAVLLKRFLKTKLQTVYITENNTFPHVLEFVQKSINRYNLDCEILHGPLKPALGELLEKRPSIKAVIMGTRKDDPHGNLVDYFMQTDGDWPPVMRVNPILHWNYGHVWQFIRGLYLPYCPLYDRGYTSLGTQDTTLPNPALQLCDRLGRVIFKPAYMLENYDLERKGRMTAQY